LPPRAQNGGSKIFAPGMGSVGSYGAMKLAKTAMNTNGIKIASGSTGHPRPARIQLNGPPTAGISLVDDCKVVIDMCCYLASRMRGSMYA
jgi:hypothetical protein